MVEVDPCAHIKPLDDLLEWWKANRSNICRGNQLTAKKYDDSCENMRSPATRGRQARLHVGLGIETRPGRCRQSNQHAPCGTQARH